MSLSWSASLSSSATAAAAAAAAAGTATVVVAALTVIVRNCNDDQLQESAAAKYAALPSLVQLIAPSDQHRTFLATLLLHTSDVSNCARPWKIIEAKTPLIMEEFFREVGSSMHSPAMLLLLLLL